MPIERYSLSGPHSLHDAWLESLEILEPSKGARSEQRATRITLQLLGAYHNCMHHLVYLGVRRYQIDAPASGGGHGDLIIHELRLDDDGTLAHELLFSSGGVIQIACDDLQYTRLPRGRGPAA